MYVSSPAYSSRTCSIWSSVTSSDSTFELGVLKGRIGSTPSWCGKRSLNAVGTFQASCGSKASTPRKKGCLSFSCRSTSIPAFSVARA